MQNCIPEALRLQTLFRDGHLRNQLTSGLSEAVDPAHNQSTDQLALAEKLLKIERIHRTETGLTNESIHIKRGARRGPATQTPAAPARREA